MFGLWLLSQSLSFALPTLSGVMTDPNGLLHMRARYYNPYLCRFISADPSGFGGGLNWYAYAGGNPVSYIDPFGLGALEAMNGGSWLRDLQVSQALSQFGGPSFTGEQLVGALVNLAFGGATAPLDMALGMGSDINTAITARMTRGSRCLG